MSKQVGFDIPFMAISTDNNGGSGSRLKKFPSAFRPKDRLAAKDNNGLAFGGTAFDA